MTTLPLARFSSRDLRALLDEEVEHWLRELLWDYAEVGSAVAAGIDRGSLAGRVVQGPQGPTAYCYFVEDGGRTVVGSLFATAACRGRGHEEMVLEEVLGEALGGGSSSRVECQTLFSTAPGAGALFARAGFSSRDRHYLVRDLGAEAPGREPGVSLRPIRREDLPRAAEIVFRSHEGSLDAALNTTYATRAHCRGFLDTLVLRGGCGQFEPLASSLALADGEPVGVLVASRLSRVNGHICQVSVLPEAQGRGVGRALVIAALEGFRRQGLAAASLSVTVDNGPAYRLYERLGFRVRKAFAAHAWARPPGRIELPS